MLPVTFRFIIAMVAYAVNEQLARRLEYLLEEVCVLREVYTESTGRKRIPFTDEQRRRLAIKGKALTPEEREAGCQIVRPSTILTWFRQLGAQKYHSSAQRSKPGRPRKWTKIRELVIRLASENIIMPKTISSNDNAALGPIGCQSRLGGLLNFYHRKAA
jgi:hypothetical protein